MKTDRMTIFRKTSEVYMEMRLLNYTIFLNDAIFVFLKKWKTMSYQKPAG